MTPEEELRRFIADDGRFTCLGARAALRREALHVLVLDELGSPAATPVLHEALLRLIRDELCPERDFVTLVAIFQAPAHLDEESFDDCLWAQLQDLHDLDARDYPWASEVESDPASARFGYSVGGHPFFVVGMHPNASRTSRRFRLPALAFNSHHQFDQLKALGQYQTLKRRIREREMRVQGSLNPNLADFGDQTEARQYSGLAVDDDWKCPFNPQAAPGR
jgi:hypothetical protein